MSCPAEQQKQAWRFLRSLAQILAINCAGAVVVFLVLASIFHPMPWPEIGWSFLIGLIYANTIGTLAWFVLPNIAPRCFARRGFLVRWSLYLCATLAVAVVGTVAASGIFVLFDLFPPGPHWENYLRNGRFAVVITLFGSICCALYESLRERLAATTLELRTKELDRERALQAATQARLAALESRVHPHFLFNTLNSISTLIQEDPGGAERMVERLASLLRFSLDGGRRGLVSLQQELKVITDYLEIEKVRFGKRLRFTIQIPEELYALEVPPLAVQTLVENSVKYAIAPRPAGGTISILGRMIGDRIELEVRDDGTGFRPDAIPAGRGLDNLQARLVTLFGPAARLEVSTASGGASVTVSYEPHQVSAARLSG